MSRPTLAFAIALSAACLGHAAAPAKTVCTITVNSADEKEAFRRRLPQGEYRFVELVRKGRPDWLRASCERAIQCDVLIVSGHFNAGDTFYSDDPARDENLGIDELERASCSGNCPGLFAHLKEVYLFGCESLNPDASKYSSSHGESGRERMRRIFAGVPVIYGFAASAPLGPAAATLIDRHLAAGTSAIGSGRASARLLEIFSRHHMTATRGVERSDEPGDYRHQICQFFDERVTPDRKLSFIHATMRRDMSLARVFQQRISEWYASLPEGEKQGAAFVRAREAMAADGATRDRYLAAERASAPNRSRAAAIALAQSLGWLTPEARAAELAALVRDLLAGGNIGVGEVALACSLGAGVPVAPVQTSDAGATAVLACLGDEAARVRIIAALSGGDERAVQLAQAYLRQRPVSDAKELRTMARGISRMPGTRSQVRALDTLGRLGIDREIGEELARSFAATRSIDVQRAIAEIFMRSGRAGAGVPGLAGVLQRNRIASRAGDDLIDVLIRRLQEPS